MSFKTNLIWKRRETKIVSSINGDGKTEYLHVEDWGYIQIHAHFSAYTKIQQKNGWKI